MPAVVAATGYPRTFSIARTAASRSGGAHDADDTLPRYRLAPAADRLVSSEVARGARAAAVCEARLSGRGADTRPGARRDDRGRRARRVRFPTGGGSMTIVRTNDRLEVRCSRCDSTAIIS